MARSSPAVCLAANLICSGYFLFTKPDKSTGSGTCTTFSSIIFLTAVFAWVAVKNINIFRCRLPDQFMFLYEFFLSLFILEMALRLFWEPIECFLINTLPAVMEDVLLDGECGLGGLYCRGDSFIFVAPVYAIALIILWSVLYGYGVI